MFGKTGFFNNKPQITHPEIEIYKPELATGKFLEPVYPTTEKLKAKGLNARQIAKLVSALLPQVSEKDIPENIPAAILKKSSD